jgi:exosortase/archaeosortase family protein
MYPSSFEATWKGRTYYLFFIWLVFLELVLSWEKIQVKIHKLKSARFMIFSIVLPLPIVYIIVANFWGLNTTIVNISPKHYYPGVVDPLFWAKLMPLSIEYLVFAIFFALIILVAHGIGGLKNFSLPLSLIGIIGLVYVIDNLYPNGHFAPFQILVPTTANFAENILKMMGYATNMRFTNDPVYGPMPFLEVWDARNFLKSAKAFIAWPCSGVDSLIIYSVTIILFLRNSGISWRQRISYFIIGAAITYFINIMRIVTIFIIGVNYGMGSPQVTQFHDYYGALYSITWIAAYPLIIIGTQALWRKIRKRENDKVQM